MHKNIVTFIKTIKISNENRGTVSDRDLKFINAQDLLRLNISIVIP